jgi:uncharacterized membrane protein HdeD (DUF308 family)
MSNQRLDIAGLDQNTPAQSHWLLHLMEGLILIVLGLLAVFMSPWLGTALFGWLFLAGGSAGLVTTLIMWSAPGFWWSLSSAIVTIGVGGVLFALPVLGMVTLTFLLIAFLFVEGIVTIMFALEHWRALSGRWALMLASGVVDLLLAVVILAGLPTASTWAIGLIVAVNLAFGGTALIGMALTERQRDSLAGPQ